MSQQSSLEQDLTQDAIKNPKKFMLLESTQIPLVETPLEELPNKDRVLANMINPMTGKPYEDGILLSGVFADLRPQLNNNKRIYSIPEYVELVEKLYTQIFSKRGLFGEFEHPERYNTDGKKVSHKILDIFYDPKTQMVYGTVLVLDTPNGKIVKEIIKSGGLVCISARAAGSEEKQPDGTFRAITKLLVTYDLVMNPGFSTAELEYIGVPKDFNQLYESIRNLDTMGISRTPRRAFSVMLYENQMEHFNAAYSDYISLNENLAEGCYIQWYAANRLKTLNESSEMNQQEDLTAQEEDDFKNMQIPKQQQQQAKLQKVADAELKQNFLDSSNQQLTGYYRKKLAGKQGASVYDDSAGFLSADPDSISFGGNTFQSFLDYCAEEELRSEQSSSEMLLQAEGLSGHSTTEQKPKKQTSPKKQKPGVSKPSKPEIKKPELKKVQTKGSSASGKAQSKAQQTPKSQGLSGSDYLSKQKGSSDSSKAQTQTKSQTEGSSASGKAQPDVQGSSAPGESRQKAPEKKIPEKKKLTDKVKQKLGKSKDKIKRNARYYLNLDMDDGNSNAGKAIIE